MYNGRIPNVYRNGCLSIDRGGAIRSHIWTTPTTERHDEITALLNAACTEPDVDTIVLTGALPPGIDGTLLENAFVHTEVVNIGDNPDNSTLDALCRALARSDCLIRDMAMFEVGCRIDQELFAAALKANTSLRAVGGRWFSSFPLSFIRCCAFSSTIEHVTLPFNPCPPNGGNSWGAILALPTLRCIELVYLWSAVPDELRVAWPNMVARTRNQCPFNCIEVSRNSGAQIAIEYRWKLRALYECAGRVLPDHVIHDIAALTLEMMDGGEESWCEVGE